MAKEREIAKKIVEAIKSLNINDIKRAYTEYNIPKEQYESVLKDYFELDVPEVFAKPDIVLIAEDLQKRIDEYMLIAVELKYFEKTSKPKDLKRKLRGAFREIGQPLRYYLYGFDCAILWHIFSEDVDSDLIRSYSNLIAEFFERMKLPVAYFSTKMFSVYEYELYKPSELGKQDLNYIVSWILGSCRERVRNPLFLEDYSKDEITKRRRALKTALRVP